MSMAENSKDYIAGIYRLERPAQNPLPLIFDSPHSGREYPDDFGHACPAEMLYRAEDNYVDDLFDCVPAAGGTLLAALFPRTYIDVNRAVTDIDAELLHDPWPEVLRPTRRSRAGTGLLRRMVKPGTPVYDRKLSVKELKQRIEKYYEPYHGAQAGLLDEAHAAHGQAWHINCHSMPATQPDFCIGDRDGTSSGADFTHALYDFLKGLGYRVNINQPYKGVEILRRHGDPAGGRHSVQMEISKALYWNDTTLVRSTNYNALKGDIQKLVLICASWAEAQSAVDLAAD